MHKIDQIIYIDRRKLYTESFKKLLYETKLFKKILCLDDQNKCEKLLRRNLIRRNLNCYTCLLVGKLTDKENVISFLYRIKVGYPTVKILLLYDPYDFSENYLQENVLSLIDGYISVEWSKRQFCNAFNYFIKEGILFPKKVATKFLQTIRHKKLKLENNNFTQRERLILKLLCEGKLNKEIARLLGIKEKTVKNHLNKIYLKLGVRRKTEAILKLSTFSLV